MIRHVPHRLGGALLLLLACSASRAEDSYYQLPLNKLKITEGKVPAATRNHRWPWAYRESSQAYATLDGEGEIYLGREVGNPASWRGNPNEAANPNAVAVRGPSGKTLTGTLYLPDFEAEQLVKVRFEIQPSQQSNSGSTKRNFLATKEDHYNRLLARNVPGGAWFRYQALLAQSERTGQKMLEWKQPGNRPVRPDQTQYEETFKVFSGGQAISENIQLDRGLFQQKPNQDEVVDISAIAGIDIAEMNWDKLLEGKSPKLDPLASLTPFDQHALFFRSFESMTTVMDEANENGTPLLHIFSERAEDNGAKQYYEKQLCLTLDTLSRVIGPQVVNSVALTGDDPFLRVGTSVTLLFETKIPLLMQNHIFAKHAAALQANQDARQVRGTVEGIGYTGVVTPDRRLCSYVTTIDNVLVVTNSISQLERLAATKAKKTQCLADSPEYRFFRTRYEQGGEDCFLVVSDATIRRWCGPKWRIASSRRTRAAGVMAHLTAVHLNDLATNQVEERLVTTNLYVPDLGTLKLSRGGVHSSTYNTMEFQTPIGELDLSRVTREEEEAYNQWRNNYQRYWRQFFDPIAISFSVKEDKLTADTTVMPLIQQTEYQRFIDLIGNTKLTATSGDPHPEAVLNYVIALDMNSQTMRQAQSFLGLITSTNGNPLSWMGESFSLYLDQDDFWKEVAQAKDRQRFMEQNFHRVPLGMHIDVKDSVKLTLFLAGLKLWIQAAAPDLTRWDTAKHADRSYVRITFRTSWEEQPEISLYYLALPEQLVVSFNEPVIKRAIERYNHRKTNPQEAAKQEMPWLGEGMALQADQSALQMFEGIFGSDYQREMQERCWGNLLILNEWKRLYPDRDPVELHQELWNARLECPGGGQFQWNEEFQTMESTVYDHPAQPKAGPTSPGLIKRAAKFNFGVTFEKELQGLRAKAEITRAKKE